MAGLLYLGYLSASTVQDRLSSSKRLIHTFNDCCIRGIYDELRVFFYFLGNLDHRVDEAVQCFFAFCFSRFDHDAFFNDEREINRWRMVAEIEQSFGNVECTNA